MKPVLTTVKNIFVLLLLTTSASASDFSPEVVREAWKKRAEKLAGFDITFETSHVDKTSIHLSDDESEEEFPRETITGEIPETIAYQTKSRIVIDGRLIRYEREGAVPNAGLQLREENFICSYDTSRSAMLYEPNSDIPYPHGFILDESNCAYLLMPENTPALFAGSLLSISDYEIDLDKATIVNENAVIDEDPCIVLHQKRREGYPAYELWLVGTKCDIQIDCKYKNESGVFVPQEWTCTRFANDGGVTISTRHTVTKMLAGQDFTTDDFTITFPVGTVVSDSRNPETAGRTGTHDYIVLENGKKRVITWEDLNTP